MTNHSALLYKGVIVLALIIGAVLYNIAKHQPEYSYPNAYMAVIWYKDGNSVISYAPTISKCRTIINKTVVNKHSVKIAFCLDSSWDTVWTYGEINDL